MKLCEALNKLQWVLDDEIPTLKFLNAYDGKIEDYFLKKVLIININNYIGLKEN